MTRAFYSAGALVLACLLLGLPGLRRRNTSPHLADAGLFVFGLALATLTDLPKLLPWLLTVPGTSNYWSYWWA